MLTPPLGCWVGYGQNRPISYIGPIKLKLPCNRPKLWRKAGKLVFTWWICVRKCFFQREYVRKPILIRHMSMGSCMNYGSRAGVGDITCAVRNNTICLLPYLGNHALQRNPKPLQPMFEFKLEIAIIAMVDPFRRYCLRSREKIWRMRRSNLQSGHYRQQKPAGW